MDQIPEFVDQRQKSWCIYCSKWLSDAKATNRDHVPTKSFLRLPLPENLPVIEVCSECNESFSADEQYMLAFLGAVISGSTAPDAQIHPRAERILTKYPSLKRRIEEARQEARNLFGETEVLWQPEPERIKRVVLKNARGHAFYEYGEPMLSDPAHVYFAPLPSLSTSVREAFETIPFNGVLPEVGSRMLTRYFSGQDLDAGWVIVQEGSYRYAVLQHGKLTVRTVLFEYLATEVIWA
jgi:hypothetical protein